MFKGNFKAGSITGTGSAINVQLGFTPTYIKVWNPNDAGSLWPTLEWVTGMAAASGFKTKAITDSGATGNATDTKITSNGISVYAGAENSAAKGFTLGADADMNVSGEVVYYIAWGDE